MRKLLITFDKPNSKNSPLDESENRKESYNKLFKQLNENGVEVYITRNFDCSISPKEFKAEYAFQSSTQTFKSVDEIISPDIILDNCISTLFPSPFEEIDCLNSFTFKQLDSNKYFQYKLLKEKMPYSFVLGNKENFEKQSKEIDCNEFILKPLDGYGGKGILKLSREEVLNSDTLFNEKRPYLVQQFLKENLGIEGLVEGAHDLRLYSLNNKIIRSYIRIPSKGNFMANLSQGGSLKEISIKLVPEKILNFVEPVIHNFYTNYSNPLFSVDLMVSNNQPFIIEINGSCVGFPFDDSIDRETFMSELCKRILKK